MKKIIDKTLRSFPILIILFIVELSVYRELKVIIIMTLSILTISFLRRLLTIKKRWIDILVKIIFAFVVIFILSKYIVFGIPYNIALIILVITTVFSGGIIYNWVAVDAIVYTSTLSLIISIPLFFMATMIKFDSSLIKTLIPIIIYLNIIAVYFRNNNNEMLELFKRRGNVPEKILKSNTKMVILVVILATFIGFIKEVSDFAKFIGEKAIFAVGLIIKFVLLLLTPFTGGESEGTDPGLPDTSIQLPGGESKNSIILDILKYIFIIISIIVVAFLLIMMFKKIWDLLKRMKRYLLSNTRSKKIDVGFVDVIETKSIFDVTKDRILDSIRNYIDETGERFKAKNKREEIRYLVKLKLKKLSKQNNGLDLSKTINEIKESKENKKANLIDDELTRLYEIARYSSQELDDIKMDKLK